MLVMVKVASADIWHLFVYWRCTNPTAGLSANNVLFSICSLAEQGELQRIRTQGVVAASQRLPEQTAMDRMEYSFSLGVDKASHEKLSVAEQNRTALSVRPAGTKHCLWFFCHPSLRPEQCHVFAALLFFQHEGDRCSERPVFVPPERRLVHMDKWYRAGQAWVVPVTWCQRHPKVQEYLGLPKGYLLVETRIL